MAFDFTGSDLANIIVPDLAEFNASTNTNIQGYNKEAWISGNIPYWKLVGKDILYYVQNYFPDIYPSGNLSVKDNFFVSGNISAHRFNSPVLDSASAVAFTFNTTNFTTPGSRLFSLMNEGVEKVSIDKDGVITGITFASVGCYPMPTLVDNNNGSITLGSSDYVFATDAEGRAPYLKYTISGGTFTLVDNAMNFIIAEYNNGSPRLVLSSTNTPIDEAWVLPVYHIFRYGTNLNIQNWDLLSANLAAKLHHSIVRTERYRRQSGLILTESAGRYVQLTSGIVYTGAVEIALDAMDTSGTDTMVFYYHSAGNWVRGSSATYSNTQYDNGTNLQSTSSNNYVVNWIFRGILTNTKRMYLLLGTADYAKLSDAQNATVPTLPPEVSYMSLLVTKIIIKQADPTATSIQSAFETSLTYASINNHNDLLGIQGGAVGSYYHSNQGVNTTNSPAFANVTINSVDQNNLRTITKDPTGFDNPENVIVTYSSVNRTITLTGTFQGYWRGAPIAALTTGWVSSPHGTGLTVPQFLYYNGSSFIWDTNSWTFDMLQIAFIYFDAGGFKFAARETHGLMAWQTHDSIHRTIGTYLSSGGDITGITIDSTTAAQRRPIISATYLKDEDLLTINAAKSDQASYTQVYLTGSATPAALTFVTGAADILPLSTNQPYYNFYTTGAWTQALLSNGDFMSVWLIAMPMTADSASQGYRYIFLQGQSKSTSLAAEQATSINQLNLGVLSPAVPEIVAIAKIIIKYQSNNWSISEVDKLGGTRLSQVSFPSGNFLSGVSTNTTLTGNGTIANPLAVNVNLSITSLTAPTIIGGSDTTQTLTYKTTTGIGATGADHIFQVGNNGNVEAMRITNAGYVGIGTSPQSKFDVLYSISSGNRHFYTTVEGTNLRRQDDTSAWSSRYGFYSNDNTQLGGYGAYGTNTALTRFYIGTYSTDEKITILANGNVGIDKLAPAEKLHITGNIEIDDSSGNAGFTMSYDNTAKALNFNYVGA